MKNNYGMGTTCYECNVCGKKYLRRVDLKTHIQQSQHFNPLGRQNMMHNFNQGSWGMAQNLAPMMPFMIPTTNRFSLLQNQGNL